MLEAPGSDQKFHRQDRKDRKESPTRIRSEELPDRNLPNRISKFSRVSALKMGSFFADFACFAVKLHCSDSDQEHLRSLAPVAPSALGGERPPASASRTVPPVEDHPDLRSFTQRRHHLPVQGQACPRNHQRMDSPFAHGVSLAGPGTAGSQKRMRVPAPGALSATMRPPCCSTRARQM